MPNPEFVKVEALRAFTLTTSEGQFHADPNSHLENGQFVSVPASRVERLLDLGWAKLAEPDLPQLDHDGDGEPGGSVAPDATPDLAALREAYVQVLGKKPFSGWGPVELQRRIDAASGEAEDGPPA